MYSYIYIYIHNIVIYIYIYIHTHTYPRSPAPASRQAARLGSTTCLTLLTCLTRPRLLFYGLKVSTTANSLNLPHDSPLLEQACVRYVVLGNEVYYNYTLLL